MSKLLNEILSRENMLIAYRKVISNKGASGVDGVTVEEIKDYVNQNWKNIKKQIETRNYRPQPVKRVEIPKLNVTLHWIYNGEKEWNFFEKNSTELDDYLFQLCKH